MGSRFSPDDVETDEPSGSVMSAEEEEQFARDVAKAIELSRISAAQDDERRKK